MESAKIWSTRFASAGIAENKPTKKELKMQNPEKKMTLTLEQKTIEKAKAIDKAFALLNQEGVKRKKMAEEFVKTLGILEYEIKTSYHKTVVLADKYAVGFCSAEEIQRQKKVAGKMGEDYCPTHYWGKNAMVQSRCDLDAVTNEEWIKTKQSARAVGVVDVHKGNLGKIGRRVYIFDAKLGKGGN